MQLSTESSDTLLVVSVSGRLDFASGDAFQQSIGLAVSQAKGRALLVDCVGLDYVSSIGLRSFVVGARTAQTAGIRFVVFGLQKLPAEVFEQTGFSKLIQLAPDRAAAEAAAST